MLYVAITRPTIAIAVDDVVKVLACWIRYIKIQKTVNKVYLPCRTKYNRHSDVLSQVVYYEHGTDWDVV